MRTLQHICNEKTSNILLINSKENIIQLKCLSLLGHSQQLLLFFLDEGSTDGGVRYGQVLQERLIIDRLGKEWWHRHEPFEVVLECSLAFFLPYEGIGSFKQHKKRKASVERLWYESVERDRLTFGCPAYSSVKACSRSLVFGLDWL